MGRFYTYHGKKLPSVTTICGVLDKPALIQWGVNSACDYVINAVAGKQTVSAEEVIDAANRARKEFRRVSKTAMDIGSKVHEAIEYFLKTGKERRLDGEAETAAFLAFLEWHSKEQVEVLLTEHTLYSERYAGTCDLVCMLGGKKYVIDFKTSKIGDGDKAYNEHRYQVAAYRRVVEDAQGCGVLYLHRETGWPHWRDTSATYERDAAVFNCLVDLWYLMHGGEK